LRGYISPHRTGHNHYVRTDILASHPASLTHYQHAAQCDLTFEGSFNPNSARPVDRTMPDHTWPKHGCDPFDSLDRLRIIWGRWIALEHLRSGL
jgi:hypothetical protein